MIVSSAYTVSVKNLLETSKAVLCALASSHFHYALHSQSNTNFTPVSTERGIRLFFKYVHGSLQNVLYLLAST